MGQLRAQFARLLHALADVVGGIESQAERENRTHALEVLARLSHTVDRRMALDEEEAEHRAAMGLLNAQAPEQWRSHYYMRQGYRVSIAQEQTHDHWRGGPTRHEGAECPVCREPLLLFWDIDCTDPRFRGESPALFGDIERLPLYYCCRRPEPTIYQVLARGRIRTFRPELRSSEESPFGTTPKSFARRPLRLDPIPRDVANLLLIANDFDFDWLSAEERGVLSAYLGVDLSSAWGIHLSQFGGVPTLTQGHRDIDCPNPCCPTLKMGHPTLRDKRHFTMKELAVIDIDAGFEMESNYAQIAFHICWNCLTIHGEYRCS